MKQSEVGNSCVCVHAHNCMHKLSGDSRRVTLSLFWSHPVDISGFTPAKRSKRDQRKLHHTSAALENVTASAIDNRPPLFFFSIPLKSSSGSRKEDKSIFTGGSEWRQQTLETRWKSLSTDVRRGRVLLHDCWRPHPGHQHPPGSGIWPHVWAVWPPLTRCRLLVQYWTATRGDSSTLGILS